MAKSIDDIKKQMTDVFISKQSVIDAYQLTPGKTFEEQFSTASIESIFFYCVAFGIFLIYTFFDLFKKETDENIKKQVPPTATWYVSKLKAYQHGFSLSAESDQFNNVGYTDAQIAASKIIKEASATEVESTSGKVFLRCKLVGDNNGDLRQLTNTELDGVKAYHQRFKPLGVKATIESLTADKIKQKWKIFYDPLILDATGGRLDGTDSQPVRNAIKNYLKNMSFNGLYVTAWHVDAIQNVPGVVFPVLENCSVAYGLLPFQSVTIQHTPDAGWMRFENENDLEIEYIPQQYA